MLEDRRSQRRREILGAARRLVAEAGLEALTYSGLEKRLSFTRGVITYHFRNKDELLAALLEDAVAEIDAATEAAIRRSGTAREMLRAIVTSNVRGFHEHREATAVLISYWGRVGHDPHATEITAGLYRRYRSQTAWLVAQDEFASCDEDALAAVIVGVVIGLVCQAYFETGAVRVNAAIDEAVLSLEARLRVSALPAGGRP